MRNPFGMFSQVKNIKAVGRAAKVMATGDTDGMAQAVENWINAGILQRPVVTKMVIDRFGGLVKKKKRECEKAGKILTSNDIKEELQKDKGFDRMRKFLGLDWDMLEEEAKEIIGGNHK